MGCHSPTQEGESQTSHSRNFCVLEQSHLPNHLSLIRSYIHTSMCMQQCSFIVHTHTTLTTVATRVYNNTLGSKHSLCTNMFSATYTLHNTIQCFVHVVHVYNTYAHVKSMVYIILNASNFFHESKGKNYFR